MFGILAENERKKEEGEAFAKLKRKGMTKVLYIVKY